MLNNTQTTQPADWPEGVIARYLTVGGATVDVRTHRFTTRYTGQGRPYVGNEDYEVDGFTWACFGCDATGATDGRNYIRLDYGRYLPTERGEVRQDAQEHAERCRALPRPEVGE
ncbi:hypothetical protein ACH49_01350 [Streptomyces leeuwenhoekii]|uniref:Uncharacterized protein n=1 Tax=Streptomyces leeuwenhoekii TaxID=1437453 RepID=A0ABR5I5S8_STRLW|nr:hypothetical protein [Streptomyces leeuwenhoekii]KMS81805.1 hypothetical protein ACH49_01350 [Streptomyces leeuwenhoekii]